MGRYLLRRLLIALPSLLGISVVLFTVLALAPGDPFSEMALNPNVPPEVQANLRLQFGLDDPVWQRYFHWLFAMLKGPWGFSFLRRVLGDPLICHRVPSAPGVLGAGAVVAVVRVWLAAGVFAVVGRLGWRVGVWFVVGVLEVQAAGRRAFLLGRGKSTPIAA